MAPTTHSPHQERERHCSFVSMHLQGYHRPETANRRRDWKRYVSTSLIHSDASMTSLYPCLHYCMFFLIYIMPNGFLLNDF